MNILIISKDASRANIIQAGLELCGYHNEVGSIEQPQQALAFITQHTVRLVICFQPHKSTESIYQQIRHDYNIPLLIIGDDTIDGDDYLSFPYQFQNLLSVVQKYLPEPTEFFRQDRQYFASQDEQETKYRDLFDRASDAILLIDYITHTIIDANEQALIMYGYGLDELIGMNLLNIVPEEQHPSMLKNTLTLRNPKTVLRITDRTHYKKDGSPINVSISASVIEYGGRKVFQDIVRNETERIQHETELQYLNELKDQFISNVSHELRTPLTSINLRLHMLSKSSQNQERHILALRREADRLEELIDNLLILARIDQNTQTFEQTAINLNALIEAFYHDRLVVAEANGITLRVKPADTPLTVVASQTSLEQVLSILLTNALNYTPSGGTVILKTQTATFDNCDWVGFCTQDTGLGIAPDEQESLFARFYRGKVGRNSQKAGTGLGLAIAKELIDQHNGRITIDSEGIPGKGTTFNVWLPANV